MTALWQVFAMIWRDQRVAMGRGAVLAVVVLIMGVALLGLSGWFITAAAAAGLAGLGTTFDVFRPSAMVRFLALGRAAARYGERVLTHDATLRGLETLRLRLLDGLLRAPHARMIRLRGAQALNRLTADIDALDGLTLRLALPVLAGVLVQLATFAMVWWLVDLRIALWVVAGYLIGSAVVFWRAMRRAAPLSRRAEAATQAMRSRLIDLIRARRDLTVQGRLVAQAGAVMDAENRHWQVRRDQDRVERLAGVALQMLGTAVVAGCLWLGVGMAQAGDIGPAFAALAVFAALALAETVAPLRRAASELGRMVEAARRVSRDLGAPAGAADAPWTRPVGGAVRFEAVTLHRAGTMMPVVQGLNLDVGPGETVAITGASGAGKSTVLLALAGLHPVAAGRVSVGGLDVCDWDEAALRDAVTMLPQRSALMPGTVADALRLGAPEASDATLWNVLEAVQLAAVLSARGGLDMQIGARGEALSGGEARRLVLARALLRSPEVLLLDEPTEGLDRDTARAVLAGVRVMVPRAAIVIAAHRAVEVGFADRVVAL